MVSQETSSVVLRVFPYHESVFFSLWFLSGYFWSWFLALWMWCTAVQRSMHSSSSVFSGFPRSVVWCVSLISENPQPFLHPVFLLFFLSFLSFWYSLHIYLVPFVNVLQFLVLFLFFTHFSHHSSVGGVSIDIRGHLFFPWPFPVYWCSHQKQSLFLLQHFLFIAFLFNS